MVLIAQNIKHSRLEDWGNFVIPYQGIWVMSLFNITKYFRNIFFASKIVGQIKLILQIVEY